MKTIKYCLLFGLFIIINGCTPIPISSPTGDIQTFITFAETSQEAIQRAGNKARRACSVQNKNLKIIDTDILYQGIDINQKTLIARAQKVLPKQKTAPAAAFTPQGYTYKATLTFKCD